MIMKVWCVWHRFKRYLSSSETFQGLIKIPFRFRRDLNAEPCDTGTGASHYEGQDNSLKKNIDEILALILLH